MRKPDLFDEIIVCLKEMSAAEVSAETTESALRTTDSDRKYQRLRE